MSKRTELPLRPLPEPAPLDMAEQDLSPPAWLHDRVRRVWQPWRRLLPRPES
jgi:hypothetical protein